MVIRCVSNVSFWRVYPTNKNTKAGREEKGKLWGRRRARTSAIRTLGHTNMSAPSLSFFHLHIHTRERKKLQLEHHMLFGAGRLIKSKSKSKKVAERQRISFPPWGAYLCAQYCAFSLFLFFVCMISTPRITRHGFLCCLFFCVFLSFLCINPC